MGTIRAGAARRPKSDRVTVVSLLALAVVVFAPLLATAPGRVVADADTALLIDPGRLLRRAVSLWDPHVGLGTVPRNQIGDLWPSGPFFWLAEQSGIPDWIAQRLWIATILFAAGAGMAFLARTWRWRPEAGAAAAFVYALSPYVITLATRNSVALLSFAGLPWLLALTIRALRTPGWRHAALFALVVATIGSSDAGALLLVGIAPAGWILYSLRRSPDVTRSAATWTAAKLGFATLTVNLWWILGMSVQATNGLPLQPYRESAEVVASTSTASEVLRGLGAWYFHAADRLGPFDAASVDYTQHLWLIALTYGLVVLGLLGLGVARWRHRVFAIVMLATGVVVSVGAHPWGDPSPFGRIVKGAAKTDLGFAIRTPTSATPLILLGIAVGVGALVGASREESHRRGRFVMVVAMVLAVSALPPLWLGGFVPTERDRPEDVPDYWESAAAYLDARDDGTRVLEIPGIDTAAYRWGVATDSITPGLMDRPTVDRSRTPEGTAAAADLVAALDRRLQDETLDADALAVVARLMNVGDIVTRNDLQYERYDIRRPRSVWEFVTSAGGLAAPTSFGPRTTNAPADGAPIVDEEHLIQEFDRADPPAVAAFPVEDAIPIVHTHRADRLVHLSGDGTGIVDAAAAGLIDGDELIRYSADVTADQDFVRNGLVDRRALIVTDSNRARAERWTSLRHDVGYTEQADGGLLRADPTDHRLPLFGDRPGIRTVAEHVGVAARATSYGGTGGFVPEHRPVRAVDGDPTTAWVVGTDGDPRGERIELSSDTAVETDQITLLQADSGAAGRRITEVEVRFDGGSPIRVELGPSSVTEPGQEIEIDQRAFEVLSIEILGVTEGPSADAGADGVGFAEVGMGVPPTQEYLRMPQDLLDAGGFRTLRYPLALVQTRERSAATDLSRGDEETALSRVVDLPTARTYRLTGTARLSPMAPPVLLDDITGRTPTDTMPLVTATSTIAGGLDHLPSNVLDDDADTRWTSAFDVDSPHRITVTAPASRPVGTIEVVVVDDDQHSVPGVVVVDVDGVEVARARFGPGSGGLRTAVVEGPEATAGAEIQLTFAGGEQRRTPGTAGGERRTLPIAVPTVSIDGWSVGERAVAIDSGCRDDLVTLDGIGVPVRITGDRAEALRGGGLDLRSCADDPIVLLGGDRLFDSTDGRTTGFDIDQLVWCSDAGGDACGNDGPLLTDDGSSAPAVEVVGGDDATVEVRITGAEAGTPFWLVLGQSFEPGWEIIEGAPEHRSTQLVDGFANGFLVTPDSDTLDVTMRFVPQNRVEIGLLLSVVGILVALGLAIGTPSPGGPVPIPLQEPLRRIRALTWEGGLPTRRDAMALGVGSAIGATLATDPLIGLFVGLLAGFATRREGWRGAFTALPAALLALCGLYLLAFQLRNDTAPGPDWPVQTGGLHTVALTAVVLLAVDVAIDRVWSRRSDFR
ncbi:alpha-(1-_3)-arabinofuranosyltransferase domain-containing protein [Actinospongicola halichondriae]|uniref:alpha-(1->3)-arabinofuranosyltransferase domain-containing protein n=1 Tax=Actinospongicola halichondriae TaxID=3236844 RepID=UPI003D370870